MTERKSILRDRQGLLRRAALLAAELTEQQREFCKAYTWTDTAKAAAEHAGYGKGAAVTASKLLQREDIQEYVNCLMQLRELASAIDARELQSMQLVAYQKAMDKEDFTNVNKAIDQMAKMIGAYQKTPAKDKTRTPEDPVDEVDNATGEIVELIQSVKERQSKNRAQ